jgi:transcriptional regulator with XRE-family HTH domain
LGQKLRRMRLDLRLQIREVAATIGVCETTITNWEHRGVAPSPKLFRQLREFYQSKGHSLAGSL